MTKPKWSKDQAGPVRHGGTKQEVPLPPGQKYRTDQASLNPFDYVSSQKPGSKAPETKLCPGCKAANRPTSVCCVNCGTWFEGSIVAKEDAEDSGPPRCDNCGRNHYSVEGC